jgi:hypothetical protein
MTELGGISGISARDDREQLGGGGRRRKSGVADVRVSALNGSVCRKMQFKNETRQLLTKRVPRCEKIVGPPATAPALVISEGLQGR